MPSLINPYVLNQAFSPNSIPDLDGWYDVPALPPQTDGTAITPTWTDRVGNVGTIVSAGPTYNTNVQNGLPGAYFGTGQGLNTNVTNIGEVIDLSWIIAVKVTDTTTGGFRDALVGQDEYFAITAVNGFWTLYGGGGAIITGSALVSGAIILACTLDSGVLQTFYENGVSVGSIAPIRNPGATNFGVGVFPDNFFGWILEAIMYSRVITGTEMDDVTQYLADKWAITI